MTGLELPVWKNLGLSNWGPKFWVNVVRPLERDIKARTGPRPHVLAPPIVGQSGAPAEL